MIDAGIDQPYPGRTADVRFTKWGGARHWEFPTVALGEDEFGWWGGVPAGTQLSRPGNAFVSETPWVLLMPEQNAWSASFYAAPHHIEVYVDMTTVPEWGGSTVTMVDLDLDVVLLRDGSLFVDDEDEFAEHQVTLGYPPEIVRLAQCSADEILAAIAAGTEPFSEVGRQWLERFLTKG